MIFRQVHVYDAVETIINFLEMNDLEDTAHVIQLFYRYDTMCPKKIYTENADESLDATLSWDDIIALQANQSTCNQDINPHELPGPSTSANSPAESNVLE